MQIQHATHRGCVVVTLTGSIDLASVAQVQRALRKHLSGQPAALICDLAGVRYLDPVFATVFSTVANHPTSRWPTTNLLLCRAQPQVAQTLRPVQASHLAATGHPNLEAEGGRGLWLVEQLARAWGVRPHPGGGKVVWCALNL